MPQQPLPHQYTIVLSPEVEPTTLPEAIEQAGSKITHRDSLCPNSTLFHLLGLFVLLIDYTNGWCQGTMVHSGTATPIFETKVSLAAGVPVRFETRNVSPDSDPVMHLLSPTSVEVSVNDNADPGYAARIDYVPTQSGNYTLIVRAKDSGKAGTIDLYKDGTLLQDSVAFGGWQLRLTGLRASETIETVKIPNGDDGVGRLYLLKPDGIGIAQRGIFTVGVSVGLRVANSAGSRFVVVGTNGPGGRIRLIRNDSSLAGHDSDGDGLGDELEREIGTCSTLTGSAGGFDCSLAADPRDTDGDGLSDRVEVLGIPRVSPQLPLPKWGTDPRHKDMFIEVSYMRRTKAENVARTVRHMSVEVARRFVAVYADSFTVNPQLRADHAAVLRNPDGKPGISCHLDIGVNPQTEAEVTMYGDWGGFKAFDAETSSHTPCTASTPDNGCHGVDPNEKWRTSMQPERRGIFRFALGYNTGGGQCGNTFACAFNFLDTSNPPHEWGHTLGLGHSGPTGTVDVNCKPNYPSIMNYAFTYKPNAGFSGGNDSPSLNNSFLKESNAVSPQNALYLDVLEKDYKYWVDKEHGHIDWNRNGVFEPASTTVRAYANYKPGSTGGCEFTRYNQTDIGDGIFSPTGPVLARLNNRLYVFYTENGTLKYRVSTSAWNCPEPRADGCANGTWGPEKDAGMPSVGVAVVKYRSELCIVSVQFNTKIMERRLSLSGQAEVLTPIRQIPGSASGEPTLAVAYEAVYLVYKGYTDSLMHVNKCVAGQWGPDQIARSTTGEALQSTSQWAFPAIHVSPLPDNADISRLYGLFPNQQGKLDLWIYEYASGSWSKSTSFAATSPVHGRPAMAYVTYPNESTGRLYMVYVTKSTPGTFKGTCRMRMSYVEVNANSGGTPVRTEKIGLDSPFDNTWLKVYGIGLFFEKDKDTNLRAVFTRLIDNDSKLVFRPKADGINDFTFRNYNDWETLRLNVCSKVVNPGNTVLHPINCPVR